MFKVAKSYIRVLSACALLAGQSCSGATDLTQGIWRAILKTETGVDIPFNFEISDGLDGKRLTLINAGDRFQIDNVQIAGDSVFVQFPILDSEIRAKRVENGLQGKWIKHLATTDVAMEFFAEPGEASRFLNIVSKPKFNITGRWSAVFYNANGKDSSVVVGQFVQNGTKVTGTFLTPTGDYRFLEGAINHNQLLLSTFDGSNAYLFKAVLQDSVTLIDGSFYSGLTSVRSWEARKNENAALPDAYSLTSLKDGEKTVDFSFPDLTGKRVSLSDSGFKNKVVVVQFLGSWCPNCMDETAFLAPFYDKFKAKGLEVVGLAYERTTDPERSKKTLSQLATRFKINYPILLTGYTNKDVLTSMPALKEFKAFPTTIIVDKKGFVRKIHTGFSGPGTGKYYTQFIEDFQAEVERLLQEPNLD